MTIFFIIMFGNKKLILMQIFIYFYEQKHTLKENGDADEDESVSQGKSHVESQPNLSIAQIIVTCATPMVEEEKKFPELDDTVVETTPSPPTNAATNVVEKKEAAVSEKEKQVEDKEQCEDDGFGGDNFGANFEAHFEANFEDAFASQTVEEIKASGDVPKQVVGGRASIPEELDSHQLERLQSLKESNA